MWKCTICFLVGDFWNMLPDASLTKGSTFRKFRDPANSTQKSGTPTHTICDPKLRTVNTAVECGAADDWYQYSPVSAGGNVVASPSLCLTPDRLCTSGEPPARRPVTTAAGWPPGTRRRRPS